MEFLLVVLLIIPIFLFFIYITYKQIIWIFNKEENEVKHQDKIRELINLRGFYFRNMYTPSNNQIRNNSFSNGFNFSFGSSDIMSIVKVSYRIIIYTDKNIKQEMWVKITESVFSKTKYKFDK